MATQKPKISVITPAYNAESYISETISSIQAQTFSDYEHIIVDDGSTDDTAHVVGRYSNDDNRIKYFAQTNGGPAAARNNALSLAKGDYIIFVDADDYIDTETLSNLYHKAKSTLADIVYYNFVRFYDDNKHNWIRDHINLDDTKVYTIKQLSSKIFNVFPILTAGKLIKSEIIRKNNISFNTHYKRDEDVDFSIRLMLSAKRFAYVDYSGYFYRINNPDSETATNHTLPTQLLQILIDLNKLIRAENINLKQSFDNYAIEQIYGCITRQEAHPNAHKLAFDFAAKSVIPKLGLTSIDDKYVYNKDLFDYLQKVKRADYTGALLLRTKMLEAILLELGPAARNLDSSLSEQKRLNQLLEDELKRVHESLSWKITKPLRSVRKIL